MTDVEVMEHQPRTTVGMLRPVLSPAALIQAHEEVAQLIQLALKKDTDYGVIPGTGTKPTLLKPGAERLARAFGCVPRYEVIDREIDHDREVHYTKRKKQWRNEYNGDKRYDWIEESGTSYGLYRFEVRCTLTQIETGVALGDGLGSCSTMESKYIDRPRECENTALKMAQKRALIAAVLNAFALSDRFTQDVEDMTPPESQYTPPPKGTPAAEKVMSIGSNKGKKLGEIDTDALEGTLKWCREKNEQKWGKLIDAITEVLEERRNQSNTPLDEMPPALAVNDAPDLADLFPSDGSNQ